LTESKLALQVVSTAQRGPDTERQLLKSNDFTFKVGLV